MSSSTYNSINSAFSIGTIVVIVIGSIIGLIILIGTIVAIVCIVKCLNRSKSVTTQGMALQQPQTYPNAWSNQYPPNMMSVANYPPTAPPYTTSSQNYGYPAYT